MKRNWRRKTETKKVDGKRNLPERGKKKLKDDG